MPHDLGSAVPRTVAPVNNLIRWEELTQGGHFGGWEQPDLMVRDLREARPELAGARGMAQGQAVAG